MYSPASTISLEDFGGAPQLGAPILYVVRHAQNDDDAQNKIRGLKDQPLNSVGERQLEAVKDFFSEKPVFAIYTDDLSRTRATAMAVSQATGVQVETDIDLRSWDVGKLEGKSMAAHKLEIQEFKTHPDKVPVGGQSWGAFEKQAHSAMGRYVRKAMEANGPIVLVTHGSFIQLFFQRYGDWPADSEYDQTPIEPSGIAAMYLTRQGSEVRALRGGKDNLDE